MEKQIIEQSKPNKLSWRWGGPGSEITLHFDTIVELEQLLFQLETASGNMRTKMLMINNTLKDDKIVKE